MTTPRITPQERSPRTELVAILEKDIAEVACFIAAQSDHFLLKHWSARLAIAHASSRRGREGRSTHSPGHSSGMRSMPARGE